MVNAKYGVLKKDDNGYPVLGGTSSADNSTIINASFDPVTRRLQVQNSTGTTGINPQVPSGTVNSVNTTFTCSGIVSVAFADGTVDVGAVISGTPNSTITYSVPPQNNVYAI